MSAYKSKREQVLRSMLDSPSITVPEKLAVSRQLERIEQARAKKKSCAKQSAAAPARPQKNRNAYAHTTWAQQTFVNTLDLRSDREILDHFHGRIAECVACSFLNSGSDVLWDEGAVTSMRAGDLPCTFSDLLPCLDAAFDLQYDVQRPWPQLGASASAASWEPYHAAKRQTRASLTDAIAERIFNDLRA